MLGRIRTIIKGHPDRTAFFNIIGRLFPVASSEYRLIEKAYTTAKIAFRDKYRETGERYFEHLRAVALIVMLYLRVTNVYVIVAAILHDIIEDVPTEWNETRIAKEFGEQVAAYVFWVTKPPVADFKNDKSVRDREYHFRLARAPREALIIKLADRIHNLLTLWGSSEVKRMRKIRETQDFYLPLAIKEIVLIQEIEAVLEELLSVPAQ